MYIFNNVFFYYMRVFFVYMLKMCVILILFKLYLNELLYVFYFINNKINFDVIDENYFLYSEI